MVFMHIPHNGLPRKRNTLRTNDVWWPDVPESHFSISESVHDFSDRLLGYRPLIQISLGGPIGKHLFNISHVIVRFCRYGLQSIRFVYQESCKQLDAVLGLEDDNDPEVQVMEWNLNDAGNEFITQFEVFTRQLGEDLEDGLYKDMERPDNIVAAPRLQQYHRSVPCDEPCTRALMVSLQPKQLYGTQQQRANAVSFQQLYTNRKRYLFSPYGSVVPTRSRKRQVNFQGFEIVTGFYGAQVSPSKLVRNLRFSNHIILTVGTTVDWRSRYTVTRLPGVGSALAEQA